MMIDTAQNSRGRQSRRIRRRPVGDQKFANYLAFGFQTTVCIGLFLATYATVLLLAVPLLGTADDTTPFATSAATGSSKHKSYVDIKHGDVLKEAYRNYHLNDVAASLKNRLADFRHETGVSDAALLEKAATQLHQLRVQRQSVSSNELEDEDLAVQSKAPPGKRSGFMVLGMHRSGTSMLSGLLVNGMGYETGGPLIGSAFDNEKGFFELLDVVLQNDELMQKQKCSWDANVIAYEAEQGVKDKESGTVDFAKGKKALKFLNNPENAPWLQKDPRMCITLRTWVSLMLNEPAIVFTYRHPLEVALSLQKREKNFSLDHGLRLWIVYNMRAIENSDGLCRVLTSNDAVMADPLQEVQRVAAELTDKCGVPAPPNKLLQEMVDNFINPALQHNQKNRELDTDKKVIKDYDGCLVRTYDSEHDEDTEDFKRERGLYLKAMKIYCDFQKEDIENSPYDVGYLWPEL